jgi:hypothetical protein
LPQPPWLPTPLSLDGTWEAVLRVLTIAYNVGFQPGRVFCGSKPVWWDRKTDSNGIENNFWHLVSKQDDTVGDRVIDYPRAKRLNWCVPVIRNYNDPLVTDFDYPEANGDICKYLWLKNEDYVVILRHQERRFRRTTTDILFLLTAYNVDGNSKRRSLSRKFSKRIP